MSYPSACQQQTFILLEIVSENIFKHTIAITVWQIESVKLVFTENRMLGKVTPSVIRTTETNN